MTILCTLFIYLVSFKTIEHN